MKGKNRCAIVGYEGLYEVDTSGRVYNSTGKIKQTCILGGNHDKGEEHNLKEWCRILKLPYRSILYRIKRGWTIKDCFEKEVM